MFVIYFRCSGANPCDNNNGGCSDTCHIGPNGVAECSCPDSTGMTLGNGFKMCVPIRNNCTDGQFICRNGRCVSMMAKCDSDNDCKDGSDEDPRLCAEHTCPASTFVCNNGRCINPRWRCDLDNDCRDGSDEVGCSFPTCSPDQFVCKNARCIDQRQVGGLAECLNKSPVHDIKI